MYHSGAAPRGARHGGRAAPLPAVLLCAQTIFFCSARRAHGARPLLSVEDQAAGFSCPAFCQECCKAEGPEGTSHERFQCVLRHPARRAPKSCANTSKTGTVACPFTEDEKRRQVWTSAPGLQWGCSKQLRCCCSARGLDVCIGDITPKERLMEAYNLSLNALPALSEDNTALDRYDRTMWGCPPGFADYDVSGRLCACSDGCQDTPREQPPAPRGLSTDSVGVQMASLAAGIYSLESPVAGWELVKAWTTNKKDADMVGIYRKRMDRSRREYTCALVFTGTNSVENMVEDLEFTSTDFCGFKAIHDGFAEKAKEFIEGKRNEEFVSYLTSKQSCGGGVHSAGHSLGGTVATLVAACYNKKAAASGDPNALVIRGLYTVGTPGMSEHPLEDAMSKDGSGCFSGSRYFNQDRWLRDPIPGLASVVGYKHAKVSEVQIRQNADGSVESYTTQCNSTSANIVGGLQDPLALWAGGSAEKGQVDDVMLHLTPNYIRRLLKLDAELHSAAA